MKIALVFLDLKCERQNILEQICAKILKFTHNYFKFRPGKLKAVVTAFNSSFEILRYLPMSFKKC